MKKGFSLLELMIVVAIIALLSALSVPTYFKYISKAKQAEVAINLASLHTAQQLYYTEHGHYTNNLQELGWKPANNTYYTYGFNTGTEGVNYFIGKLKTPANSLKHTTANDNKFVASAAGKLNKMDVWTIDHERNIKHVQDGLI